MDVAAAVMVADAVDFKAAVVVAAGRSAADSMALVVAVAGISMLLECVVAVGGGLVVPVPAVEERLVGVEGTLVESCALNRAAELTSNVRRPA